MYVLCCVVLCCASVRSLLLALRKVPFLANQGGCVVLCCGSAMGCGVEVVVTIVRSLVCLLHLHG